jgi:metal-responsive CopG/Arc/MetJ family transcriptional regulator
MKKVRVSFTIPEEVIKSLNNRVEKRKRSAFVALAVSEKLNKIDKEELIKNLVEGYQASAEEDAILSNEWESATLENWPD